MPDGSNNTLSNLCYFILIIKAVKDELLIWKVSGSIYSVSAFKDLYFVKVDIKYYSKLTSMVWIRFYISLYLRCKRTQREHEVISKCSWFAFPHSAFISCWWRSWTESKCLKLVTTSLWRRSLLGVFLYTTLLP